MSAADPVVFVHYENWWADEDLTAHFQTPHVRNFAAKATDLLAETMNFQACHLVSADAPAK